MCSTVLRLCFLELHRKTDPPKTLAGHVTVDGEYYGVTYTPVSTPAATPDFALLTVGLNGDRPLQTGSALNTSVTGLPTADHPESSQNASVPTPDNPSQSSLPRPTSIYTADFALSSGSCSAKERQVSQRVLVFIIICTCIWSSSSRIGV